MKLSINKKVFFGLVIIAVLLLGVGVVFFSTTHSGKINISNNDIQFISDVPTITITNIDLSRVKKPLDEIGFFDKNLITYRENVSIIHTVSVHNLIVHLTDQDQPDNIVFSDTPYLGSDNKVHGTMYSSIGQTYNSSRKELTVYLDMGSKALAGKSPNVIGEMYWKLFLSTIYQYSQPYKAVQDFNAPDEKIRREAYSKNIDNFVNNYPFSNQLMFK